MPIDVFVDVEAKSIVTESINSAIADVGSLGVGEGSQVMRADQSGLWLGAEKWADAPFRVNMQGDLTATSLTITGYIPAGGAAADVNANAVTIDADKINISGSTTFSSGYDPTDKVDELGGQYDSAASGARVRIFPTSNIGLQIIDGSANNVFLAYVGGTDVGDVIIGDYNGNAGIKWDNSASEFKIRGDMDAGTITGVTFKTSASGARVEIQSADQKISIYDSGNDECFFVDDEGGFISIKALDSRNMNLESAGGLVYIDALLAVTDDSGIRFDTTRSTAESYDWGIAAYKSGGNYGWVSRMDGGTWTFDMTAGTP